MIELLVRLAEDVTVTARGNDWSQSVQPAVDGTDTAKELYFQTLPRLFTLQAKLVAVSPTSPYTMADLLEGLEAAGYIVEVIQGNIDDARETLRGDIPATATA